MSGLRSIDPAVATVYDLLVVIEVVIYGLEYNKQIDSLLGCGRKGPRHYLMLMVPFGGLR